MKTKGDVQIAYCPYGYRPEKVSRVLLAFNGEWRSPLTDTYMLGNGVRVYEPALRRFRSSDMQSPFGGGGVNSYCYCGGDPVNRSDPSGRMYKHARYDTHQPNLVIAVVGRQLHGTDLKQARLRLLDKMTGKDLSLFFTEHRELALEGLQRVTRNALVVSRSSHNVVPDVGLLKADAKFIADNIFYYRRKMEIHARMGRAQQYLEAKKSMESGVQRFQRIVERRLDAIQGEDLIDKGDPEFNWLSVDIRKLRLKN